MNPTCRPKRLPSRQRPMPRKEDYESLPAEVEYDRALDKALKLLAVRSRSRSELQDRLGPAGFSPEVVEKVDARLGELGLVDDMAFAMEWAGQATDGRGLSSRRIRHELTSRGVPPDVADEAVSETADFDRALALARRRALTYGGLQELPPT